MATDNNAEHNGALDAETLAEASKLTVYDGFGNQVEFGSLFRDKKTVVVFIRHFFCGQYVMQLASVPKESLEQAGVKVVIVGCGEWSLIKNYCETTGYAGELYADPSRALYRTLGLIENLNITPAGEEKRSYLTRSLLGNVMKSIWNGPLKSPQHIGKQGNISQLGADYILGPGQECTFASRMQHTEDHVEVAELMKHAGVTYP
ncbi:hypothetical protein CERSUDRAFT_69555 [Gelatoporia subvermispora B]|uniref:Thioredoxin domain-containing protein n=1 Tax=Ceriporiopsis subvermispora (strain B) TaxID=914234 RepID=M2QGG4_CERS8|nr:hypothetical protein CERSUDRAFT_69555 [Gelatoporia subvermispora B]